MTIRRVKTADYLDLSSLHLANNCRYPYLLESTALDASQDSYDILFAFPEQSIVLNYRYQLFSPDGSVVNNGDFLEQLDQWWGKERIASHAQPNELPFTGGWFLFLAYELASQIEHKLSSIPTDSALPVAMATRVPAAIIRRHQDRQLFLVVEAGREQLLDLMESDLKRFFKPPNSTNRIVEQLEEDDSLRFLEGAQKILGYLYEGDIFQANLSREYRGKLDASIDYVDLYRQLRLKNPAPFAGLARIGHSAICSSSPERLVRVRGQHVDMRPIAGTRPRAVEKKDDAFLLKELINNPKEQAEHIMLVDLIRNDLGRICQYDSINIEEDRVLETYAHVHHIVSNIGGNLTQGTTPGDVVRALFPGGTITGCPKVRCMEIIAELESQPRGAYTGSMGYLNLNGDLDLNILIRTIVCHNQAFYFRTGAGIVADSIPSQEIKETRDKAKGLLRALGQA